MPKRARAETPEPSEAPPSTRRATLAAVTAAKSNSVATNGSVRGSTRHQTRQQQHEDPVPMELDATESEAPASVPAQPPASAPAQAPPSASAQAPLSAPVQSPPLVPAQALVAPAATPIQNIGVQRRTAATTPLQRGEGGGRRAATVAREGSRASASPARPPLPPPAFISGSANRDGGASHNHININTPSSGNIVDNRNTSGVPNSGVLVRRVSRAIASDGIIQAAEPAHATPGSEARRRVTKARQPSASRRRRRSSSISSSSSGTGETSSMLKATRIIKSAAYMMVACLAFLAMSGLIAHILLDSRPKIPTPSLPMDFEKDRKDAIERVKNSPELILLKNELIARAKYLDEVEEQGKCITGKLDVIQEKLSNWSNQLSLLERQTGAIRSPESVKNMCSAAQTGLASISSWREEALSNMELLDAAEQGAKDLLAIHTKTISSVNTGTTMSDTNIQDLSKIEMDLEESSALLGTVREHIATLEAFPRVMQEDYDWGLEMLSKLKDISREQTHIDTPTLKNIAKQVVEETIRASIKTVEDQAVLSVRAGISKETAESAIQNALEIKDLRGMTQPDYANILLGAKILHHPRFTSRDYGSYEDMHFTEWLLHYLRLTGHVRGEPAEAAISKSTNPGDCWAFRGDTGVLTVQLFQPIIPTDITIEHSHILMARGKQAAKSAPNSIRVDGWTEDPRAAGTAPIVLLDHAHFTLEGQSAQTFHLRESVIPGQMFKYITLYIDSNHGGAYTCLYGLRVHGRE